MISFVYSPARARSGVSFQPAINSLLFQGRGKKVLYAKRFADNLMELCSTRLTQKAMLKPTNMLLIKPIAAVVWRWSLIFHTTCSLIFFPSLFLFFPLCTSALSRARKITVKYFHTNEALFLSRTKQHQIDYDFYRAIFSISALEKLWENDSKKLASLFCGCRKNAKLWNATATESTRSSTDFNKRVEELSEKCVALSRC